MPGFPRACHIFQVQHRFKGSLLDEQYDTNPTSLLALIQMILGGTDIENQTENNTEVRSAALSITQLLVFNAMKLCRKDSNAVRHNLDRETRLPLYLGLIIHNKTRKRQLIDILFEKGLSVSYDRVLQLSTDMANGVIDQFSKFRIQRFKIGDSVSVRIPALTEPTLISNDYPAL